MSWQPCVKITSNVSEWSGVGISGSGLAAYPLKMLKYSLLRKSKALSSSSDVLTEVRDQKRTSSDLHQVDRFC